MKTRKFPSVLVVFLLAMSMLAGAFPIQAGYAQPLAPTEPEAAISPEGLLNPDGSLNLSTGFQGTLDLSGWEVTLDSQRGPLLAPVSRDASAWDPSWQALSSQGLNGQVYAIAVVGRSIYVGGTFTATGDGSVTGLNRIALYDNGSWYALERQGLNGEVYALAVIGDNLYVGGTFTTTGDGSLGGLNGIARYHMEWLTPSWNALPNQGLNGGVYALAVSGTDLYVGGAFTATGDTSLASLGNMARYNTFWNTWHALTDQGMNGAVHALAVDGDDLYVGGEFTATGSGSLTNLGRIARYHTHWLTPGWHALPNQGLNGSVLALAIAGSNIYAGGTFNASGDGAVTGLTMIAYYDTTFNSWNALANQGLNSYVYELAVVGRDLYVGGSFFQTADGAVTGLGRITRYDTFDHQWLTPPNGGLNNEVTALAVAAGDLYVGGAFVQTSDGALANLGRVARYNFSPNAWSAMPNHGLNGDVYTLAVVGSQVYVGGAFAQTSDGALTDLGNIARYDTIAGTWHGLAWQGLNNHVYALAVVGGDLYVGGVFTASGDGLVTNLNGIARYNLHGIMQTWHALPNQGLNGNVEALMAVGSDLYVGGYFSATGGGALTNLGNIARYDTSADTWHALARNGLDNAIAALAGGGSDLYVGGYFSATGDGALTNLGNIARYDLLAGTWHALSNQGLNGDVYALASYYPDLYVGGDFAVTGDGTVTLSNIARYDTATATWHALPNGGLNLGVRALAVVLDSKHDADLYVGGWFDSTADETLVDLGNVARFNLRSGDWQVLPNRGVNDIVHALAVGDGGVFAGGEFNGSRDGVVHSVGVAHYGDVAWRPLYWQGVNGDVEALAVVGSDLVVGGRFTATGDGILGLEYIALYDTVYGGWYGLPNGGLNDNVYALAVVGDNLYVGGAFTATGDGSVTGLNRIARFDTLAGTWHALPNQGLNSDVEALAVMGSNLYVGGEFTATGSGSLTNLGRIARFNTATNTWHALPNQGLDDPVNALAALGDTLYLGGEFYQTGDGTVSNLNHIARYDTLSNTWSALANQGLGSYVYALAVMGTDLYVGGDFGDTWDGTLTNLGEIARYDTVGGAWHALPNEGLYGQVLALAVTGSDLYVGGEFEETDDETMNRLGNIARYDSTTGTWHALPNQGLSHYVNTLLVMDGSLYAGGHFERTGDGTLNDLGMIARIKVWYPDQDFYQIYLPLLVK